MPLDGRIEKRIPMAMAMNLVSAEDRLVTEKVLTENVSPHGARVVTNRCWQPGDQAQLVPSAGESGFPARVVYCHRRRNGLSCLGLEFRARSVKLG
jgi:PilZ domain